MLSPRLRLFRAARTPRPNARPRRAAALPPVPILSVEARLASAIDAPWQPVGEARTVSDARDVASVAARSLGGGIWLLRYGLHMEWAVDEGELVALPFSSALLPREWPLLTWSEAWGHAQHPRAMLKASLRLASRRWSGEAVCACAEAVAHLVEVSSPSARELLDEGRWWTRTERPTAQDRNRYERARERARALWQGTNDAPAYAGDACFGALSLLGTMPDNVGEEDPYLLMEQPVEALVDSAERALLLSSAGSTMRTCRTVLADAIRRAVPLEELVRGALAATPARSLLHVSGLGMKSLVTMLAIAGVPSQNEGYSTDREGFFLRLSIARSDEVAATAALAATQARVRILRPPRTAG